MSAKFPAVFPLGFGASPLGSVFGPVVQSDADAAVHGAIDLGIDFFDVAPYYGETRAEAVLGKALQGIPRERYFLATKVGRYTANGFDFSYQRVLRSIEESLERLKIDVIDLAQCHDIEFVPERIVHEEALPALRKAREQGKIRFVGISGLPTAYLRRVAETDGNLDTVLSYCHLTLADSTLTEHMPVLREMGLTVINASPLAMGLLADRPLPEWHPAPEALRLAAERAVAFCQAQGTSLPKIALQYALSEAQRCGVAVTLTGMRHIDEVRQNVAWAQEGDPAPDILHAVQAIFSGVHNLTWETGLPENRP
jgi:L-galactose dehydrogenase